MAFNFQGSSEYDDKYKQFASHLSASFIPDMEQALPAAGRKTIAITAPQYEPSIQQKKRVKIAPTASLNTDFFANPASSAEEDYVLLGNQNKFASNVKYWNKHANRDVSPPKMQKVYTEPSNMYNHPKAIPHPYAKTEHSQPLTTPLAPRKEKVPIVDAINTPVLNDGHGSCSPFKADKIKKILDKERNKENEDVKNLNLNRGSATKGNLKNYKKNLRDFETNIDRSDSWKKGNKKGEVIEDTKGKSNLKKMTYVKPKVPLRHMEPLNEPPPKSVAVSDKEDAKDSQALRYKAGLSKPSKGPKRQSEYQREFEWKTAVKTSPLIDAVQMVHGGQSHSPSKQPLTDDTEYSRQYKQWQLVPPKMTKPIEEANYRPAEVDVTKSPSKRKRPKRSKSLESSNQQPAGVPSEYNKGVNLGPDPQGVAQKCDDLEEKMEKLRKKHRHIVSEYNSNYKSPNHYQYVEGAWMRGKSDQSNQPAINTPADDSSRSWFQEVLELREKAAAYRKRAQGTHFSREHLVQLLARQAQLWEDVSSRGTVSALSLETPSVKSLKREQNVAHTPDQQSTGTESEGDKVLKLTPAVESRVKRQLMAWDDEDKAGARDSGMSSSRCSQDGSSRSNDKRVDDEGYEEGRVPTPDMVSERARRHHLDRTTPAMGGAILVSPKSAKSPARALSTHTVLQKGVADDDSDATLTDDPLTSHTQPSGFNTPPRPPRLNLPTPTPTFGSPSYDSHILRDDDASSDRPLQTRYLRSPLKDAAPLKEASKTEPSYKGRFVSRSKLNDARVQHGDDLDRDAPLSRERLRLFDQQQGVDTVHQTDDALSVSARSVASSCSLASEVLERARKRRDFWGQSGVETR